jgi:CheY-like chemotaxis protein
MYFPAYPRAEGEIAFEAPERAKVEAAKTASGFILVVEDQDEVRAQIVEALTDMGCEVAEAADGPSALEIIESLHPVDMLVTDVGLPLLNGKQLADAARAVRPELPIILITGYAGSALVNVNLPKGVEILRKPFSLEELTGRIAALLAAAN